MFVRQIGREKQYALRETEYRKADTMPVRHDRRGFGGQPVALEHGKAWRHPGNRRGAGRSDRELFGILIGLRTAPGEQEKRLRSDVYARSNF